MLKIETASQSADLPCPLFQKMKTYSAELWKRMLEH